MQFKLAPRSKMSALAGLALTVMVAQPGIAQAGATPEEIAAGKACLQKLCAVMKGGGEPTIQCALGRKWSSEDIRKGFKKATKISWTLGDARCDVNLSIDSAKVKAALAAGENELKVAPQAVKCTVTKEGKTNDINFTLAPVLKFKDGVAVGASLGIGNIKAPAAYKAVLWSAEKLDSIFGAFQKGILREVNKFLKGGCDKL